MVNVHLCKKNHNNQVHQKKLLFLATTKKNTIVLFLKTRHDLETWYFAQRYVRTFSWTWRSRNFEFRLIKKLFFLVTTKNSNFWYPLNWKWLFLQSFTFSCGYIWSMCIYVRKIIKIGCTKKNLLFLATTKKTHKVPVSEETA